jgi:hypothetical protein
VPITGSLDATLPKCLLCFCGKTPKVVSLGSIVHERSRTNSGFEAVVRHVIVLLIENQMNHSCNEVRRSENVVQKTNIRAAKPVSRRSEVVARVRAPTPKSAKLNLPVHRRFFPFSLSFTTRWDTIRKLKYKTRNQISSSVLTSDTRSDGMHGPVFQVDLTKRPAPAVTPQFATCGVSAFLRGVAVAAWPGTICAWLGEVLT